MKKKLIRLTESDLHRIVENSVKRVLKEAENGFDFNDLQQNGSREDQMDFDFFKQ